MTSDATNQLRDELEQVAWRLHVTGLAFADPHEQVARSQLEATAAMLVAQLTQDDDDRLSAQTAIDVMVCLWPHVDPEHVDPHWWRSPLGKLVARSMGRADAEAVSQSVAAAMLGVTRGTVAQLVARGTLDRHPDGGVLRASVLQRLAR